MPVAFGAMLAMQAAGMVVDYYGRSQQNQLAEEGMRKQIAAIESTIALSRLQTEENSLEALKNLRQNLGSQAAVLAARGVRGDSSIAPLIGSESEGNFRADERMRRINQMVNERRLKAGMDIARLDQKTFENKNWNQFSNNIMNRMSSNPEFYEQLFTKIGSGFSSVKAS